MAPRRNILAIPDVEPIVKAEGESSAEKPTVPEARLATVRAGVKRKAPAVRTPLTEEEKRCKREKKAADAVAAAEERKNISVGIDLGTTFSGIAYAVSNKKASDIQVITQWGSNTMEKVPTRVAYSSENKNLSNDGYGYAVRPAQVSCSFFKLLLCKEFSSAEWDDEILRKVMAEGSSKLIHIPANKTAEDVATDYLRFLYDTLMRTLRNGMGVNALANTPIVFNLTVPATWSPAGRDITRQCAIRAGFEDRGGDSVALCDEPECAALAAMRNNIQNFGHRASFQRGSCSITVDIGGGTIDTITHKIVRCDPLQLEESCCGEAGKAGSTSIDRALYVLLTEWFGVPFTSIQPKLLGKMMADFEDAKRRFKGADAENEVYELPLSMNLDEDDEFFKGKYDFLEENILITSEQMEKLFQCMINAAFTLLCKQIQRTIKANMPAIKTILLCGGMANSEYVQKKFNTFIDQRFLRKVELIVPDRVWSCVAVGASMKGLELERHTVLFRRSKHWIGICAHEKFNPSKHDKEDFFHDEFWGDRARDQMLWHVKRGEQIRPSMVKKFTCSVVIKEIHRRGSVRIFQDIYRCGLTQAPNRIDETVLRYATVEMEVSSLLTEERKMKKNATGNSASVKKLDITISITMGSDKGVLLVSAKAGRKEIGAKFIDYVADPNYRREVIVEESDHEDK